MTTVPSSNGARMVTGLFQDRESAEHAYRAVADRGYSADDINVVMSDDTRKRYFSDEEAADSELGTKAAEGGKLGGPIGGTIGTVLPALVIAGGFAISGLGLVFTGPVAVALAGAGAAGLAFGLMAALSDWGIPEERIQQYQAELHDGGILLGVKPRTAQDARHFEQQWRAFGGRYVHA